MELYLPNFDVNEAESVITEIHVKNGDYVRCGDIIISVENTKMTKDLLAEEDGYIKLFCEEFEEKKAGDLLAILFSKKEEYEAYQKKLAEQPGCGEESPPQPQVTATKKAITLAEQLHVDIQEVAKSKGAGIIKTADIQEYVQKSNQKASPSPRQRINQYDRERVVIIGAGKGAEIVIDILMDDIDKYVVGLVDSFEKEFQSYSYPLLPCTVYDFPDKIDRHQYDTVILSIGYTLKTMAFRNELFRAYKEKEIAFTNAIAKDANIRRAVKIGTGNMIMHNCYIGTGTEIGDNNIISYGLNLGHHCTLGDGNLFGPGFTTAGCVEVGSECIIMTGVHTRSFLSIGSHVVLPVGYAVKEDIPDNTIIQ